MDRISRETRSRVMSSVRTRDTAPEVEVRSLLHKLGFRFRLHRKDLKGKPDVVLPGKRSVIFVHGCFWHGHDCPRGRMPESNVLFWEQKIGKNKRRDVETVKTLENEGWRVLTIWQCQTREQIELRELLVKFLCHTKNKKRAQ